MCKGVIYIKLCKETKEEFQTLSVSDCKSLVGTTKGVTYANGECIIDAKSALIAPSMKGKIYYSGDKLTFLDYTHELKCEIPFPTKNYKPPASSKGFVSDMWDAYLWVNLRKVYIKGVSSSFDYFHDNAKIIFKANHDSYHMLIVRYNY